jgi:aminoglycoside N3'-acetyltransferase
LVADHYRAGTPCGKHSPFDKLLQRQGKILLAGVDIRSMTFFHYVEELLEPQMPFSPFTTEWFELSTKGATGEIYRTRTRLFDPVISSRRDTRLLIEPLRRAGSWHEGRVGKLHLVVLSAADVVKTLSEMSNSGRYCYRTQSTPLAAR